VYKPYPVDSQYTDAQAGIDLTEDKHENQQYTVGVIDVPRESTETAYTVEKSIRALEQMMARSASRFPSVRLIRRFSRWHSTRVSGNARA
jgi:hypothetical protein